MALFFLTPLYLTRVFQSKLYVLAEHATGFGVFKVKEFEEIGMMLPQIEASINDVSRFNSIVQLVSFSPFKTALAALENINAVSEGILSDDLHQFLDITVPKGKKTLLGVIDPKLAAAITEAIEVQCSHIGVVPEIVRGESRRQAIWSSLGNVVILRSQSSFPSSGQRAEPQKCGCCPARSWPCLLQSKNQVQRPQGGQYDHPIDCFA